MDLGGLAGKVGGTAKEAARGALTSGLLNATGQGAMNGQINYAEYEYDANGHIKGISSRATEMVAPYNSLGIDDMQGSGIDGNYSSLAGGKQREPKTNFLENYPGKYDSTINNYNNFKRSYEKEINEAKAKQEEANARYQEALKMQNEAQQEYNNEELKQLFGADNNLEQSRQALNSANEDVIDAEFDKSIAEENSNYYAKKQSDQKSLYGMIYNNVSTENFNKYDADDNQNKIYNNPISDIYSIKLPDWNYADFINERAIWQKGLSSIFDEPGWFYFKLFFDFDTDHGLFGGLLNSKYLTNSINSAAKYLYSIRTLHKYAKPKDRINALYKFTSILSYINTTAPWYFKSIKGLNKAAVPLMDDFGKEKYIELEVTQDAIDMRLSTIMSLYNFACFDQLTAREIIPPNLRKFNMSVIIFQTPLRYLHTSYTSNEKTEVMGIDFSGAVDEVNGLLGKNKNNEQNKAQLIHYKTMNGTAGSTGNYADVMSMKVYTFWGCEFDSESFANIIPGSISNEKPFQLGNSTIKITYTTCAEHTMNEFYAMMWGSDGFYFNQYSNFQLTTHEGKSWNGYVSNISSSWEKQTKRYEDLYNTFSDIARGGTILGLIDKPKTYLKAIDATEAIMNGLFDNPGLLKGLATNFALGLLGSSKSSDAPQGNIYGDYGINSAYYKDKLEMLKNGVHERTTAPYYYDPETGARVDFHKDKTYSAYNFKNDISAIKDFNVTNWLDTQTQKMASRINDSLRTSGGDFTQQPYKPNPYNKDTAQGIDSKRFEGVGKNHDMVDDPNEYTRVEKPFNYDAKEAINYENNKISKQDKTKNQLMVDNQTSWDNVEKPYSYNAKEALTIENSKTGGQYKSQELVNDVKNSEHKFTISPYKYDNKTAIDYENNKEIDVASKDMVDIIGNPEHESTEAPFKYEAAGAIDYENSKAGGQGKVQDMVDGIGNPEHEFTEQPFNYDAMGAIDYENSKAGGQGKVQDMVDGIGNPEHEFTEQPFNYDAMGAIDYENSKAGGQGKVQDMVDGIGNPEHEFTEQPFNYDAKGAVDYENSKAGGQGKVQDMVDGIGNPEHEFTEPPYNYDDVDNSNNTENTKENIMTKAPFNYDAKEAINYENSKAGGQYKNQSMVDGIGNPIHEFTEPPFNYDSMGAIDYENSKAGDMNKIQNMVDGIGNPDHEFTEPPFNYDAKSAIEYENKKIEGEYKDQSMVDGVGNPEHEFTELPFNYDSKEAINYENGKAGGPGKIQDMIDNGEHRFTVPPYST